MIESKWNKKSIARSYSCFFLCVFLIPFINLRPFLVDAILSNNPNDVKFYLFPNGGDWRHPQVLQFRNESSLQKSSFRRNRPTVIIIPGGDVVFNPKSTLVLIKGHLSSRIKGNYIAVEWVKLNSITSPNDIPLLFVNVAIVGNRVAELLTWLVERDKISLDHAHLIGSSMGGQIASIAGQRVQQMHFGRRVARITGLDPAGFAMGLFGLANVPKHGDAHFVDVFHSNIGYNGSPLVAEADVDIVLNKGDHQPGCDQRVGDDVNNCSHRWAIYTYVRGLRRRLTACKCPPWKMWARSCDGNDVPCHQPVLVGPYVVESARGMYHLKTGMYEEN